MRDDMATEIAAWIEGEAIPGTNSGTWCVYSDEIRKKFGVDVRDDTELLQMILLTFDSEMVADTNVFWEGDEMAIELTFWDDVWMEDE